MDNFGISKLDLKRRNRMQVLKLLRHYGPTSRIDISAELELTRAAVTIITNEMIEQGVIYEKGEINYAGQKAKRGRKKILIDINNNYKFTFGVAVNDGLVSIGLANLGGETLDKKAFNITYEMDSSMIIDKICMCVNDIKNNNCLEDEKIAGMCVCVSENDYESCGIPAKNLVPDFTSFRQSFEKRLGFPVEITKTAYAMAYAEIDYNISGEKPDNMVFIKYGKSIDAAVVVDNKIFEGANGGAANIAHITVNNKGRKCRCGKTGCAATEITSHAVGEKIAEIYSKENTPVLFEATGGNVNNITMIFESFELQSADPMVASICKQAADVLAEIINSIIIMIDPAKIVLAGDVFKVLSYTDYIITRASSLSNIDLKDKISVSPFNKTNMYLAGCASAARKFFIERGGFDRK